MIPATSGRAFLEEYAERNNLVWIGNRAELRRLIPKALYDEADVKQHDAVLEHVACFQTRGAKPVRQPGAVLAVSFPYLDDGPDLREQAEAFAVRFGLSVRVNHPDDRVYNAESFTPVAFWREDFYDMD